MEKHTVEEVTSITYKLRQKGGSSAGWADITLREWKGGGSFNCQSDYGNYAYTWGAIGERTLRQFLCGLDMDYFMKKAAPGGSYEDFSVAGSIKALRQRILDSRMDGRLDKITARLCWDDILDVECECDESVDLYFHKMMETEFAYKHLCGYDPTSIPSRYVVKAQCEGFWERVWGPITEYWSKQDD